jgi:cystathionine beta-lyase family protein involved in aluminum resistance
LINTNQEIETALRNYHWLVKEVARLKYDLGLVGNPLSNKGEIGPKTGRPFNPTLNEVIRREQKQETLEKFEDKIHYVERNTGGITNDRELTVLNCLLDGMNINNISRHMGYSKRTIYSIKESIIEKIKKNARNA